MILGCGTPHQHGDPTAVLAALGNVPNYNWLFDRIGEPGYTPMLWSLNRETQRQRDNFDAAVAAANQYPDVLWLLGNEPKPPTESNTEAHVFAESVREWQRQTTNPIAVAGELIWERQDEEWHDEYLAAGGPIPEFWHIHNYANTPAGWEGAHRRFVAWMERNGVVRPVIVSETAAAGALPALQRTLLEWLPVALRDLPHLHSIYWYSSRHHRPTGSFNNSNLTHGDGSLTELGETFVAVQAAGVPKAGMLYMPTVER